MLAKESEYRSLKIYVMTPQIDKSKTNGCGAMGGIFRFVKPPHHEFFRGECELHDMLYEIGGTSKDRKIADVRLFQDMVRHSTTYFQDRSVRSQMWYITLSFLYYLAVRLFGSSNFRYTDNDYWKENKEKEMNQ